MSKYEDAFYETFLLHGLPESDLQRQYFFSPEREYRFDFAFPSIKLAIEVVGMGYGHQRIAAIKRDIKKRRLAAFLGWLVIEFETGELRSENQLIEAVETVNELITLRIPAAKDLLARHGKKND